MIMIQKRDDYQVRDPRGLGLRTCSDSFSSVSESEARVTAPAPPPCPRRHPKRISRENARMEWVVRSMTVVWMDGSAGDMWAGRVAGVDDGKDLAD